MVDTNGMSQVSEGSLKRGCGERQEPVKLRGRARQAVSYVELYLDLVFVLAVGRLAHVIVDEPELRSVWIALGGFVVLWWTWIGFAVLYNRHGEDDRGQHLRFLAGSIPIGVAAVALVATFMLGRLHRVLSPHAFLYVATAWVVGCAALSSRRAAATRPYRGTR